MRLRFSIVAGALALATGVAVAGERGAASVSIEGKKLTIDYGRPQLKGRTLAELMKQLPEDRIWRAGDDQVTTLSSEADLRIGGKKLPAGRYSMYIHLAEDGSRSLVINSDLGIPLVQLWAEAPADMAKEPWPRLDGYQKSIGDKELVRATMKKETVKTPQDTFTIALAPAPEGAMMKLSWGEESWSIAVQQAK